MILNKTKKSTLYVKEVTMVSEKQQCINVKTKKHLTMEEWTYPSMKEIASRVPQLYLPIVWSCKRNLVPFMFMCSYIRTDILN